MPFLFLLCVAALFAASCAQLPKEKPPELYWPFPPEKPRIKFVDMIIGSIDVTGVKSGFNRLFFGEEPEIRFRKPLFITGLDNVVYVTDAGIIHVYDFNRKKFRLTGGGVIAGATGIAVAPGGRIFVGDSVRKKVFVIDEAKGKSFPLGDPDYMFENPGDVAIDEAGGRVVVGDSRKHSISVWGLDGKFLFSFGKRGMKQGEFNFPYGVAVDKGGRIYVVDSGNFRVQVFDREGKFIFSFGDVGLTAGQFSRPKGIALDSEGHIYVVDAAFGNFQIFDINGNVLLAVGSHGNDPAKFILPSDIYIDKDDKIYVVDQMNKRLQVFQYIKYPAESTPASGPADKTGLVNGP